MLHKYGRRGLAVLILAVTALVTGVRLVDGSDVDFTVVALVAGAALLLLAWPRRQSPPDRTNSSANPAEPADR